MASLMKKLFDTMPLAGVQCALTEVADGMINATLGQARDFMHAYDHAPRLQIQQERPGIAERLKAMLPFKAQDTPIWGYETDKDDPTRVTNVTCRVREDHFNNYVVAEEIRWGHASMDSPWGAPGPFTNDVKVLIKKAPVTLPLTTEFLWKSFKTKGGFNAANAHHFWPLFARHDEALLHVFVYNVLIFGPSSVVVESLRDQDQKEVRALDERLERLNSAKPSDRTRFEDFMFQDNLWPTGAQDAAFTVEVGDLGKVTIGFARILVACSLTPCRERDDYQPGQPMGVGRLYPHILVTGTTDLERVEAGVQIRRPSAMTVLDGACGCDEMTHDMGALVVTDSNKNAMALLDVPAPGAGFVPHIYWANLFNYYVADPAEDAQLKGKVIPVVVRHKPPSDEDGSVMRDCSDIRAPDKTFLGHGNLRKVTKLPGEGAFDNIHMAPKMKMTADFDYIEFSPPKDPHVYQVRVKDSPTWKSDLKMDKITMAPFCAHDCFHLHWRWGDNDADEPGAWGWGRELPHSEPGLPMVPQNQDVFLVVDSATQISYLARAHDAKAGRWQPFLHHGTGYALSIGKEVYLGRVSAWMFDSIRFMKDTVPSVPIPIPAPPYVIMPGVQVDGGWSLMYWRLRYTFDLVKVARKSDGTVSADLKVKERFSFTDREKALKQ
jgi:hypothetical protein